MQLYVETLSHPPLLASEFADKRRTGFGGEAVSLNIPHSGAAAFAAAGYAELKTTPSHVGGRVRQHGLLSFSRVFQAGHEGEPDTFSPPPSFKKRSKSNPKKK